MIIFSEGGNTYGIINETSIPFANLYSGSNAPSTSVQSRGNFGGEDVQGRGSIGEHKDHAHPRTHYDTKNRNLYHTSSTNSVDKTQASKLEPELYSVSDKIGVPLYILSPKVDPLLNNIENPSPYYQTN